MSSLEQLLSMFDLKIPFNESDLKIAKKKVLMLHPDKNLNTPGINEYYLKYLEAYKRVEIIYNHIKHATTEDQLKQTHEADNSFKDYIEKNGYKDKEFLTHFNHMFVNVHIKTNDEENGYTDWLKSKDDYYNKDNIEQSRQTLLRNIVKIEEPKAENVFEHKYSDLKEAHMNTIIGIDEKQVLKDTPQFKNVNEYQQYRKSTLVEAKSDVESKQLLQETYKQNTNDSLKLAYEYKNRQEQMEIKRKEYNSNFFTIL